MSGKEDKVSFHCGRCHSTYFATNCGMEEKRTCRNCLANNYPAKKVIDK